MKRVPDDGAIEEFKPKIGAVHLEVGENLIITCATMIDGSSDGRGFRAAGIDKFAELTAGKSTPPL